jgi:glycosyltransferase involved in cell wall biosynthesis
MSAKMLLARVAIVIPAFNESEVIAAVVTGFSAYGVPIVVNDGSTDNTEQLARGAGAIVVGHRLNSGYDKALASGLARAVAEGFDFAITADGDGQHQPTNIETVLCELSDGADLVVGVRDRFQRFSETLFSILASRLWGISDPLCGMKGYRLSRLRGVNSLQSYSSIGTELVIRAVRSGWNIKQIPVSTRDRKDQSRFGVGVYANWVILRAMLLGLFRAKAFSIQN